MITGDAVPVGVAVVTAAGALFGERVGAGSAHLALLAALCALLAARTVHRRSSAAFALCGIVAAGALGCAMMQRALDGQLHHNLVSASRAHAPVVLHGVLVDDPLPSRYSTAALLRVDRFTIVRNDTQPVWRELHRIVLVSATAHEANRLAVATAGDRVDVAGDASPVAAHDQYWSWRHAVAAIERAEIRSITPTHAPHLAVANWLRDVIESGLRTLAPADRALAAGFVLGDTRAIDATTSADFRQAGLGHLLAVSGANVAFVLALVGPLRRRLSLRGRFALGLAVVIVFATMTRFEPSVLRASVMAAIAMLAQFSGRRATPGRVLAFAVTMLVSVDPFLVHSVGFLLSVAASAGIAWLAPALARRLPGPSTVREVLAVSIAAQIGVAPVLWFAFGSVPWVAPAANVLAVPAAEPITVLAIPGAMLAATLTAPGRLLLWPVTPMLTWVRVVAHAAAHDPVMVCVVAGAAIALTIRTMRAVSSAR